MPGISFFLVSDLIPFAVIIPPMSAIFAFFFSPGKRWIGSLLTPRIFFHPYGMFPGLITPLKMQVDIPPQRHFFDIDNWTAVAAATIPAVLFPPTMSGTLTPLLSTFPQNTDSWQYCTTF